MTFFRTSRQGKAAHERVHFRGTPRPQKSCRAWPQMEELENRLLPSITVINTNDSGPGSLRQAILDSNASVSILDTIDFNIPGPGLHTIQPLTPMEPITDSVLLDGYSQPGSQQNTLANGDNAVLTIELDGTLDTFAAPALSISGSKNSIVQGLVINRFLGTGVMMTTPSNVIRGNFIGTDASGTLALGNAEGVRVGGSVTQNNTIGGTAPADRNVISGNNGAGVILANTFETNYVMGNFIGTNAAGTAAVPNFKQGVLVDTAPAVIGGTAPGTGNLISGNGMDGISISSLVNSIPGSLVQGNWIGINATGTQAIGNGQNGVAISSPIVTTVGGITLTPGTAAGNVISGNAKHGIQITGGPGNFVQGNLIGTNAVGVGAVPNLQDGVLLSPGSSNNLIGGTVAGAGNVISGNLENGVEITSNCSVNQVQGNWIGTDVSGSLSVPNGTVLHFNGAVKVNDGLNNLIGGATAAARNILSGNKALGVLITGNSATGNQVQGNYIGLKADGLEALPNGSASQPIAGVYIRGASNNTVGGITSTPGTAPGNVISGNSDAGVEIDAMNQLIAAGNVVEGNLIGTDKYGTATVGNSGDGVDIRQVANDNFIGGSVAGAGNVISGNMGQGVHIESNSIGNFVQGNLIGTDPSGTVALANVQDGVRVEGAARFNTIGGITAAPGNAPGNVISGNGKMGVNMSSGIGNAVQGNAIGTDRTGTLDLGNGKGGVAVDFSDKNTIGGPVSGSGNMIAFNHGLLGVPSTGFGVMIHAGTGNVIRGNSIFSNFNLGIDLGGDGVTINDNLDTDLGANDRQNYPVLASVTSGPGNVTTVQWTFNSAPNTTFALEFFASASADSSGFGEGATYLGTQSVITNGFGNGGNTFSYAALLTGQFISATATVTALPVPVPTGVSLGDTSEFSQSMVATAAGQILQLQVKPGSRSPHPVNLNERGMLPVAILSTQSFDARSVDRSDLQRIRLGDVRFAEPMRVSPVRSSLEDINDDGRPDLLLQFSMLQINERMALVRSTTMVELTAFTTRWMPIRGTDLVQIVPSSGGGGGRLIGDPDLMPGLRPPGQPVPGWAAMLDASLVSRILDALLLDLSTHPSGVSIPADRPSTDSPVQRMLSANPVVERPATNRVELNRGASSRPPSYLAVDALFAAFDRMEALIGSWSF